MGCLLSKGVAAPTLAHTHVADGWEQECHTGKY